MQGSIIAFGFDLPFNALNSNGNHDIKKIIVSRENEMMMIIITIKTERVSLNI